MSLPYLFHFTIVTFYRNNCFSQNIHFYYQSQRRFKQAQNQGLWKKFCPNIQLIDNIFTYRER